MSRAAAASADAVYFPGRPRQPAGATDRRRPDQALATRDIHRREDRGEIVPVTLASTSRRRWIAAERRIQPGRRRGARGEDAPTLRERGRRGGAAKITMPTGVGARIFARAERRYAKLIFLPSLFDKLLESFFPCFPKSRWMPS